MGYIIVIRFHVFYLNLHRRGGRPGRPHRQQQQFQRDQIQQHGGRRGHGRSEEGL